MCKFLIENGADIDELAACWNAERDSGIPR